MKVLVIKSPKHGIKNVLLDDEDYERVVRHKWSVIKTNSNYYATARLNLGRGYTTYQMHRIIMRVSDKGVEIDHRDHNGLNNQKSNLRKCTKVENQRNRIPSSTSRSKYKGVTFHAPTKKWKARINNNGTSIYLGLFTSEKLAAMEYDKKAIELFGEFACTNL